MPRAVIVLIVLTLAVCLPVEAAHPPQLNWEAGEGWRRLAVDPSGERPGFTRLTPAEIGIHWTNRCSPARYAKRQNLLNGTGVALGDYDGDGWCDVYLCNREGANALFRNLGGWRFTNATERAGVAATHLISSGAIFADFNGDGHLDLHVTSFLGPDALYLNKADGTFTNIMDAAGARTSGGATSSAASDLDGDGDLDLYVARFAVEAWLRDGAILATRMVGGRPVVTGRAGRRIVILNNRLYEYGEPDLLLLNDGNSRFTPVSWPERFLDEAGQPLEDAPQDLGFAVQLRDINDDGLPDIYVCNDFQTPDRCWINQGKGQFRAISTLALRNMSYASMGVDFADVDRDGHLDFYTVEMLPGDHFRHMTHIVRGAEPDMRRPRDPLVRDAFSRSILSWNRGDGTYAEIAWFASLATSDWSWTPIFVDVDLDGYEDLLISSGYPHDVNDLDHSGGVGRGEGRRLSDDFTDQLLRYPPLDAPSLAWRNQGNLTFENASQQWDFNIRSVLFGMALADLDNDGDADLVGSIFNEPPLICRNNATAPRLAVRLKGLQPNTRGTGARIRLKGGPVPVQEQEMLSGGRYLSSDQYQRVFSAAGHSRDLSLEIRWRGGGVTTLAPVLPNSIYEVDEATAQPATRPALSPLHQPWFLRASPPSFTHQDPPYDEFGRQPSLPWRQSFQGPGVLWVDWDLDQHADLIFGNGRGASLAGARFDPATGAFNPETQAWAAPLPDDALGLLALTLKPGLKSILVALSSYESGTNHPAVLRLNITPDGLKHADSIPGGATSPGPLAAGDLDGDGDLDLVVAGRMIPGHYPRPANTRVFRNEAGTLVQDTAASTALAGVGLVSGALITDLVGDPRPELVLACEWGPIKVFSWESGTPVNLTATLGLENVRGIWQGLAAADLDSDGRMDIIAGNWGHNSHHQRAPAGPWQLFHHDIDGDGRVSIVEAYFHQDLDKIVPVRPRDILAQDLPWLPVRFPTHADFARASIPQILGPHADQFAPVEATTLASVIFLNRGESFVLAELPPQAQWTPVFDVAPGDFDGDGDEDLFCSQNFFAIRDEEDRMDAGRGLLLWNEGPGRFSAVPGQESGILIYGEQRGAAVADYNADGRLDLVVAQNSGPPVLLANQRATPGLRVRLRGAGANPDAVGTRVRLLGKEWQGPIREVRAGNGRYSQDSDVLILGGLDRATHLWVQFPGRAPEVYPLSPGIRALELAPGSPPIPAQL
jgi:hypothetical protein